MNNELNEFNISEVIDGTEQYFSSENHNTDVFDSENSIVQNSEDLNSEEHSESEKKTPQHKPEIIRNTKLPMARIKNIMKMDPDELFLEMMAKETYTYTTTSKRKTIAKKDLDLVINKVDCLCFLEGALDF
ncbi:unnamed protein product [Parnassius apollo]|uniref:(apollo) hypothetical protein n=1 Tax=Parnassius apollo TaxID=110799 RepID=A0A8S3W526_PARAO|nr:unnamed protein product [Parnassius apollo]